MKICLVAGKRTHELFSYLQTNFRSRAEVTVWFPKEELSLSDVDVVILDHKMPRFTEELLEMEHPPLIVITQEGTSHGPIQYLPDFAAQFPSLADSMLEKEPLLTFVSGNEAYRYRQKDVISLVKDGVLTVQLRSGKTAVSTDGFRKICRQLRPDWFFAVGKTAMVNASYVSRFSPEGVLLQNGRLISCTPEECVRAENAFFKAKLTETPAKTEVTASLSCQKPKKNKKI